MLNTCYLMLTEFPAAFSTERSHRVYEMLSPLPLNETSVCKNHCTIHSCASNPNTFSRGIEEYIRVECREIHSAV